MNKEEEEKFEIFMDVIGSETYKFLHNVLRRASTISDDEKQRVGSYKSACITSSACILAQIMNGKSEQDKNEITQLFMLVLENYVKQFEEEIDKI